MGVEPGSACGVAAGAVWHPVPSATSIEPTRAMPARRAGGLGLTTQGDGCEVESFVAVFMPPKMRRTPDPR